MSPSLALLLICIVITILLYMERKSNPDASLATWVPTCWMLICGSRPVGRWFYGDSLFLSYGGDEAGSGIDRLVLSVLILLASVIIIKRRVNWSAIFKDNMWLIIFYLYLGVSISWSDYEYVSLKRWIRLITTIPIAIVILSERNPFNALVSVFRRCAYILIPLSIVLIKYFRDYGVEYARWSGKLMWIGVATQKNSLGIICAFSIFVLFWNIYISEKSGKSWMDKIQLFTDALVCVLAIGLLVGPGRAYSATSIVALTIGVFTLILLKYSPLFKRNLIKNLRIYLMIFIAGCLALFQSIMTMVSQIVGRSDTFTGRTDIWEAVLDIANKHPFIGVGYGSFWGLRDEIFDKFGIKQAHNGYLDVYLVSGAIGLVFLFLALFEFTRKVQRENLFSQQWCFFSLSFAIMILLFNICETAFVNTGYLWNILILLNIVFTIRVMKGKSENTIESESALDLTSQHVQSGKI